LNPTREHGAFRPNEYGCLRANDLFYDCKLQGTKEKVYVRCVRSLAGDEIISVDKT
jgi:hypothetical protein